MSPTLWQLATNMESDPQSRLHIDSPDSSSSVAQQHGRIHPRPRKEPPSIFGGFCIIAVSRPAWRHLEVVPNVMM
jgi:hypothetical protein